MAEEAAAGWRSPVEAVEVVGRHADGVPFFLRGPLGRVAPARGATPEQAGHALRGVLARVAPAFQLRPEDLVPTHVRTDGLGHTHVRFAQHRNGLPVIGAELLLHLAPDGAVYAANGSARDGEPPAAPARLTAEEAVQVAGADRERMVAGDAVGVPRRVYVRPSEESALRLAFEVTVSGRVEGVPATERLYVDAENGTVLVRDPDVRFARNRVVYSADGGTQPPVTPVCTEPFGCTDAGDIQAVEHFSHLGKTYECFMKVFGYDSYNGLGAQLRSVVDVHAPPTAPCNAYWNGSYFFFSRGDGIQCSPLGRDSDLVTHEFTHKVTDSTSGLSYSGESGALDEALSDVLAATCVSLDGGWVADTSVWKIGESSWTPGIAGDALRYMHDPGLDVQSKDFYPERYTGSSSVAFHGNAGIINLAFKLLATGGTHPRGKSQLAVPSVGVERAARVFFYANANLMTPSTTLAQAKSLTQQAALILYDAQVASAVDLAWQAVGLNPSAVLPVFPPECQEWTGLAGDAGTQQTYAFPVEPGVRTLEVGIAGAGNGDLYVRQGQSPTTSAYDCRPFLDGGREACLIDGPDAGTWYAMVRGGSAFSGVTLRACRSQPACALVPGNTRYGLEGSTGSEWHCALDVPPGASNLRVELRPGDGGTGDGDLYVRYGQRPTQTTYGCRPNVRGSTETCTTTAPGAGTWHVMLHGYAGGGGYRNLNLRPSFTVPDAGDTTPPETSFLVTPSPSVGTPYVTVHPTSEPGARFECRLGSGPIAFSRCDSPVTVPLLTGGSYRLEVRARDVAGNVDPTPAIATWSVDLTAPAVSITSGPPAPGAIPGQRLSRLPVWH
ncbi:M4 family metallopeptidase [Pyxidicoccus xibeiensis]|uniref:M4 family metallopeptidase n=1 Tax=Pyxidicoccus xibeiensis TaxID=2906759 RepID=UPI0020A70376|nr:M4 family metallopeptidase [Pyxidicoccus xibeiensis]MCP3138607.1 M4 family metallopeptidase [Pyxidicoccus xibeiensis]